MCWLVPSPARLTLSTTTTVPYAAASWARSRGWGRDHLIEVVDIAEVATQHRFRHLVVNAVRQQLTVYDRPGNLYHGVVPPPLDAVLPVFAD